MAFTVGDTVIAQFSEDGVWYVAKIDAVSNGNYTVTYIEYGNTEGRTEEFIRPMWKAGDKVEAQFSEDSVWYTAEITGPSADGKGWHVRYTEYSNEEDRTAETIRPVPGATNGAAVASPAASVSPAPAADPATGPTPDPTPARAKASKHNVGDTVIAQFSQDGVWYVAKIDAAANGHYTVTYTEYGNTEDRTEEFIRPLWKAGDKVEAKFSEDSVWYAAEITGPSADGKGWHVRYTEYGNEEDRTAEAIRPVLGAAKVKLDWAAESPAAKPAETAAPAKATTTTTDDSGSGSSNAGGESSGGGWASSGFSGGIGFGSSSGGFGGSSKAPTDTLFVGGLSFRSTEDSLTQFFSKWGTVLSARIVTDRDTGKSRGFGHVQLNSVEAAKKAKEEANGADLDGRSIRLDFSAPPRNPGRPGGGAGGSRAGPVPVADELKMKTDTVFVGRLSYDTTEEKLREIGAEFGEVRTVRITKDKETGMSKGSGYIQYYDWETTKLAVEGLHGRVVDGREIKTDWAKPSREFDETATRKPYTPPAKSASSGGRAASSSYSSGGASSSPFSLPVSTIVEAFNPVVMHPNRKVEVKADNSLIITRTFDAPAPPRSGLFAHIRS